MSSDVRQRRIDLFYRIVVFFLVGCFIGCVFETILCYFQRGYFESRRGLIYGPFNPVYGVGIAILVFVLEKFKKNSEIFIGGFILGGIIEYACSWVQEVLFHTISWDYSKYFMNFNGRTSLFHMICWGILGLFFMRTIYPAIVKVFYLIKENYRLIVASVISIFFAIDICVSGVASFRMMNRINRIAPRNNFEILLDKMYPDSFMIKIYPNARDTKSNKKIKDLNY